MAALDQIGYVPKSKGDIMKAMCRLWMNQNSDPNVMIEQKHIDFVNGNRPSNNNVLSKPKEEKSWLGFFPQEDKHAANCVFAHITGGHANVEENLMSDDEKLVRITQKLVDLRVIDGPKNDISKPIVKTHEIVTIPDRYRLISDEEKQAIKDKEERDLKAVMEQFNNGTALPEEE